MMSAESRFVSPGVGPGMPLRPPEFRVIARSPGTRPAKAASDPNYMTSLARGLSVIRAFTGADPQLTIAEVARIMSVTLNVGSRLPAYCTTMGRVLLSQLPREEIDEFLGRVRMRPITEKTITSRDTLRRVLDQVLEKGYALVDQELEIGLRSIAVPVRGATGAVIAAMNASAQASRISRREMEGRFLPVLQQGAGEVAQLFVRTGLSGSAAHSIARPT